MKRLVLILFLIISYTGYSDTTIILGNGTTEYAIGISFSVGDTSIFPTYQGASDVTPLVVEPGMEGEMKMDLPELSNGHSYFIHFFRKKANAPILPVAIFPIRSNETYKLSYILGDEGEGILSGVKKYKNGINPACTIYSGRILFEEA